MTYKVVLRSAAKSKCDKDQPEFLKEEIAKDKRWLSRLTLSLLGLTLFYWGLTSILTDRQTVQQDYLCSDQILSPYDETHYIPEQIHLSLGQNDSEVLVTWSLKQPAQSEVYYNVINNDRSIGEQMKATGELTVWTSSESDPGVIAETQTKFMDHYTYRATLTRLRPNSLYTYKIVANNGEIYTNCRNYRFQTKDWSNPEQNLTLAFYGDLGVENGQSIPRLIADVERDEYNFIIHNGDFAYDLNVRHGTLGDEFMRMIQPIAARVPYQTSVGNHEVAELFLHYDQRFSMVNSGGHDVGKQNNFYYSYNAGPVHFIAISTEHWYYLRYIGLSQLQAQWEWLKEDLRLANQPEERAKRPWIVVYGHRPMYCSGRDRDDCSKDSCLLRKGLPFLGVYSLEKLLFENGVDVELYSHEHQYERFLPIYKGQIYEGTDDPENPYFNPRAPVHLTSGSAGCKEDIDPFNRKPAHGSVIRVSDYGYTKIKISGSACRLEFEQISDDKNGTIEDRFVITKNKQNFPTEMPLPRCESSTN